MLSILPEIVWRILSLLWFQVFFSVFDHQVRHLRLLPAFAYPDYYAFFNVIYFDL